MAQKISSKTILDPAGSFLIVFLEGEEKKKSRMVSFKPNIKILITINNLLNNNQRDKQEKHYIKSLVYSSG